MRMSSCEVSISGYGASLLVKVLGYENPDARQSSDANWLECKVSAKVNGFSADFPASFTTQDFARFRQELGAVLTDFGGTASFRTHEDALRLSVELRRTGSAYVEGIARIDGRSRAALSFEFASDQTFLRRTHEELGAAIRRFPIKHLSTD